MRYGLFSYPGLVNLGDAIQSVAARRFLPRVDLRIPRERVSQPPEGGGPIRLIANGWFMHDARRWPPHPAIEPLLISMHFADHDFGRFQRWRAKPLDRLLAGAGADYLRARGPVGARDPFTAEQLNRCSIPNYHSGCLTMTLRRDDERAREDFIVACDLAPAELEVLRRKTRRRVVVVTHIGAPVTDPLAHEAEAEAMLTLYSCATAVVTTRVHAALPCLGLETPVLLLQRPREGRRVSDAAKLVHSGQGADFVGGRLDFDFDAPPPNPETFRPLAAGLEAACRAFVSRP